MGNSTSKGDAKRQRFSRHDNTLRVPGASTHRRSRSATAALGSRAAQASLEHPPPPYSRTPPPALPPKDSYGSKSRSSSKSSRRSPSPPHARPLSWSSVGASSSTCRTNRSGTYLRTPMRQQTREDALETLRKYNTVLVVDDSSSMLGSLWSEATDALANLADLAGQYDTDGIDIHFLNSDEAELNVRSRKDVEYRFRSMVPKGITPIGDKLEELLQEYLRPLERAYDAGGKEWKNIKPVNYIVITDGAPTDDPESVIVQAAKRLDKRNFPITQVGIQFVQIGNSSTAAQYLKELDDDLTNVHQIRDIVDTTPYQGKLTADMLVKILLGGINRRVDTRGSQAIMGR